MSDIIADDDVKIPQPGVEYYEGRSEGWKTPSGRDQWWEKFIVWDNGFNGLMKCVCRRLWKWSGGSDVARTDYEVYLEPWQLTKLANPGWLPEFERKDGTQ